MLGNQTYWLLRGAELGIAQGALERLQICEFLLDPGESCQSVRVHQALWTSGELLEDSAALPHR